jgi:hypothetical protein
MLPDLDCRDCSAYVYADAPAAQEKGEIAKLLHVDAIAQATLNAEMLGRIGRLEIQMGKVAQVVNFMESTTPAKGGEGRNEME